MTDKKLTDKEIIKALECCYTLTGGCEKNCPMYNFKNCNDTLMAGYVRDLINRQNAEIERLKECPKCVYEYDGETMEYCVQGPCSNFKTVEQIKSEAYKEFADKLKEKSEIVHLFSVYNGHHYMVDIDDIDNLVKEMVGEEE